MKAAPLPSRPCRTHSLLPVPGAVYPFFPLSQSRTPSRSRPFKFTCPLAGLPTLTYLTYFCVQHELHWYPDMTACREVSPSSSACKQIPQSYVIGASIAASARFISSVPAGLTPPGGGVLCRPWGLSACQGLLLLHSVSRSGATIQCMHHTRDSPQAVLSFHTCMHVASCVLCLFHVPLLVHNPSPFKE